MAGNACFGSIGSSQWPGLAKLIEECGEVLQVAGKLVATGGKNPHWDGSNLVSRLAEETADLLAAINFVIERNFYIPTQEFMNARIDMKSQLFDEWHSSGQG